MPETKPYFLFLYDRQMIIDQHRITYFKKNVRFFLERKIFSLVNLKTRSASLRTAF